MIYESYRHAASYEFRLQSDLPSASFVFDRLFSSFPEVPPTEGIPTYRLSRSGSDSRKFALDLVQLLGADVAELLRDEQMM